MYNTAISALGKANQWEMAEKLFGEIPEPDKISFETMIAAYGLAGQTARAEMFFNAMLDAGYVPRDYAFCGLIAAYRYCFWHLAFFCCRPSCRYKAVPVL